MALDPGWAGVLGAAVGALGTVGLTMTDRVGRRREAVELAAREDHVRDLALRRSVYAECLKGVREATHALGTLDASVDVVEGLRSAGIEPTEERFRPIDDAVTRCQEGLSVLAIVSGQMDLLAAPSVHQEFEQTYGALARHNSFMRLRIEISRGGPAHGSIIDSEVAGRRLGLIALPDVAELRESLIAAMRADLRLRDPERPMARSRPTSGGRGSPRRPR